MKDTVGRMMAVAKKRAARGLRTPMIDDRPRVAPHLVDSWDLWESLHSLRQISQGAGPSPLSTADVCAHLEKMGATEHHVYMHVLALEACWLEWARAPMLKRGAPDGNAAAPG